MNKTSRELSLHLAKVCYSGHRLLEEIYNSIIQNVNIENGYQTIDDFAAMNTARSELKNYISYLNIPYTINVYLSNIVDYKLKGKLDYSTAYCQGFGDLIIYYSHGTVYVQMPNTVCMQDHNLQKQFTINWLISKTYTLK